jgi:hypothetical protein
MKILSVREMLVDLVCSKCRQATLTYVQNEIVEEVVCTFCGANFPCGGGVIDFLIQECLDQTNLNEIKGNEWDLSKPDVIEWLANKEKWNLIGTHSLMYAINIVHQFILNYNNETILVSLGSGSGFELKALCSRKRFHRVYSSDISRSAIGIVPHTLSKLDGEVGLFVAEFNHVPVSKREGVLGFVFQSLHHTTNIHQSLETLLEQSFLDLVIVEPTTNWFVEVLSFFGLAKRIEYSGLKPSWMNLRRVREIAKRHGYRVTVRTWWEFPPELYKWFDWNPIIAGWVLSVLDFLSWVTSLFCFGAMSAILFTIPRQSRGLKK